ncbi:hypothetical protein [Halopiger aswanensis]|uniref:PGF-CTERM protein n=1 Tax=Halopiger aswanensis TaxID=148449 RepID=A0A419WDD5_9EURY|nr:hypothetical protein [Halopiger aswanensis]RKD93326.1 hypothetical protein ATJ93_2944 [Halopiger aswanensis]
MGSVSTRRISIALTTLLLAVAAIGLTATPLVAQETGHVSSELTITVTDDGEVESQEIHQELPLEMAEGMEAMIATDEYDDFAEYLAETIVEAENGVGDYESAETREEDDVYVVDLTLTDIETDELDDTAITVADGTVSVEMPGSADPVYGGEGVDGAAFAAGGEHTVTVEMPGEIRDSNALEEDGTAATWHLHEEMPETLTVESGTGGGDDGLPGFGPAVAICGFLLGTLLLARHRT